MRILNYSDSALQVSTVHARAFLFCDMMYSPFHYRYWPIKSVIHDLQACITRGTTFTAPSLRYYSMLCPDQYSLGPSAHTSPSTAAAVDDAIKDGSKWVLKPQREGGGNNLYGSELSEFLLKNKSDPLLSGIALVDLSISII